MKNYQVSRRAVLSLLTASAVLFLSFSFSAANNPTTEVSCPQPVVSLDSQSEGAVSFSWNAVTGAVGYNVKYVRDDTYNSGVFYTTSTSISFSSLPAGTYDFYFETVCSGGSSGYIIWEDLIIT